MNLLWCYFSTNSRIDRTERIALLFQYELLNRSNGKNSFEVVSKPTNNLFLCSLPDRNFGVILHRTLWDGYMIQLYQHCWEIALVKVCTQGLIFNYCNTVFAPFYHLLPCYFLLFALRKLISTIHTTLLSPSLCRTSAPIQFAIVLGVLGTQEISCI